MKTKSIITCIALLSAIFSFSYLSGQEPGALPEQRAEKELKEAEKEFREQKERQASEFRAQYGYAHSEARRLQRAEQEMQVTALPFGYTGQNSTHLILSKNFEKTTSENAGEFEIEESVRTLYISIHGVAESGSLIIKLTQPGGDIFKELKIDESADIKYSQSISLEDEESKLIGKWKYIVKARETTGAYHLSIRMIQ